MQVYRKEKSAAKTYNRRALWMVVLRIVNMFLKKPD